MDTTATKDQVQEGWTLQISPKTASGTLANIRGRNEEEFTEALRLFKKYGPEFGFNTNGQAAAPVRYVTETTDATAPAMQVKQAPPVPAGNGKLQHHVTVRGVTEKPGGRQGKWWLLETDSQSYSLFDSKLALAFSKMIGVALTLTVDETHKNGKTYYNIKDFAEAEVV